MDLKTTYLGLEPPVPWAPTSTPSATSRMPGRQPS